MRNTKKIKIGNIFIGGDSPIAVQSMTNTDGADFLATKAQIISLQNASCDIVRISVPDMECARVLYKLKCDADINIPIVADIHFDYKMALESIYAGADKIRINPGNIGAEENVKAVVDACKEKNIPIRIGVNSGSLEKEILEKYGAPTPEALAESALKNIRLLEKFDFDNIVISIKSSSVATLIKANRILSEKCKYPLHIGVTEAGGSLFGTLKNAAGIGGLLVDDIGDTIRVSLTDKPEKEVEAGINILKAVGKYEKGYIDIVSCPTCARTQIDLMKISDEFSEKIKNIKPDKKITVAIMGCVVNGPGEAKEADIGFAGGKNCGVIFKKGEIIKKIPENTAADELYRLVCDML